MSFFLGQILRGKAFLVTDHRIFEMGKYIDYVEHEKFWEVRAEPPIIATSVGNLPLGIAIRTGLSYLFHGRAVTKDALTEIGNIFQEMTRRTYQSYEPLFIGKMEGGLSLALAGFTDDGEPFLVNSEKENDFQFQLLWETYSFICSFIPEEQRPKIIDCLQPLRFAPTRERIVTASEKILNIVSESPAISSSGTMAIIQPEGVEIRTLPGGA